MGFLAQAIAGGVLLRNVSRGVLSVAVGAALVVSHGAAAGAPLEPEPETSESAMLGSDALFEDDFDLSLDVQSEEGQSGLSLNQDANDAAFVRERSEANGFELLFEEGRVDTEPEAGHESSDPQDSQRVLGQRFLWIADDAQSTGTLVQRWRFACSPAYPW